MAHGIAEIGQMNETEEINRARLATLSAAWAAGDSEAAAASFAPDGVYAASVGPEPGATYSGRREIRKGIAEMIAHDAGARMVFDAPIFMDDHAIATWTYWMDADDSPRGVRGCDIFTFSDGLILKKDAFRKTEFG